MTEEIDMTEAIRMLDETTPLLRSAREFVADIWGCDVPGLVLMGSLASELTSHINDVNSEQMAAIYGVIEKLMQQGDDNVQTAAATGFLESMLSDASAGRLDFSAIRKFIGPESGAYCVAWNRRTLGPSDTRFDP